MNRLVDASDILVIGVIVATMLAWLCFPWLGIPKRFSLRSLLIATTLLAVALGLARYSFR